MNGETTIEGLIQAAYNSLKSLEADEALSLLASALKQDYEHPEVLFGMKCVSWWLDRMNRLEDFDTPFERGGFILSQWKSFRTFEERVGAVENRDACVYALRRWVFSTALSSFGDVLGEGVQDPELLFQIGRCYKGVGDYEEAVKHLEQAAAVKHEDAGVLSELADVNALLGDERASKVLFREAFFLDAQLIDLGSLESEMIIRLIKKVAELGYEGGELAEWIPVYGTLWGIFSVKRELKAVEQGKLKQSILALEGELRNGEENRFLKPRLLNRYFRLIDCVESARRGNIRAVPRSSGTGYKRVSAVEEGAGLSRGPGDGDDAVAEIMMKIRFIDEAIYEQYRN